MEQPRHYLQITPLSYTGALDVLTYHCHEPVAAGTLVAITIGRRKAIGLVTGVSERPNFPTKAVGEPLDTAGVPAELIELANWLSEFYAAPLTSVLSTMLPAGLGKRRRAIAPGPARGANGVPTDPLTDEQSAAIADILNPSHTTHLLQGVTGSGKTRVYLELAAASLAARRSVIMLVPEITLTPQMIQGFERAFGEVVLASHSKLTEAKRQQIWERAAAACLAGEPRIIIGPRSCLFMPTSKLGLIVIDECHESTYKQERTPRYHAVTAAAWIAGQRRAKLVLGSATPGVQELYLAQQGRIGHAVMKQRVQNKPLPQAEILDLRNKDLFKSSKFITQKIIDAVQETVADGRQALLYLNRRGSASSQVCGDCGHVTNCPNCRLPLTFHADLMRLICHHCNYRQANQAVCPECAGANLRLIGTGTKRVEAEIGQLFPTARIARLDRDSATLSHIHKVLQQLKARELDILVGTQMIAKGLDLPAIDTVGVIGADTLLHLPDYSAAERTFQLLSQVSGRAGRGDRPGRVYIQTYSPQHPAIVMAAQSNYEGFANTELAEREALAYPPFCYLLKLEVVASTSEGARDRAGRLAEQLHRVPGLKLVGPAPAFLEFQGNKHHWIITVKSSRRPPLVQIANQIDDTAWTADLDPINLL